MNRNINKNVIQVSNIQLFCLERKKRPLKKEQQVIVPLSVLSSNEATICEEIEQIPYYHCFFDILHECEELTFERVEERVFEKLDLSTDYYLFKYNNRHAVDLIDFLYSSTSIKKLLLYILDAFDHLLNGLSLLWKNDICYLNVSPRNILFLGEKPMWSNFKYSLQLQKITKTTTDPSYVCDILQCMDDFTYMPFELHLLYYVTNSPIVNESESFVTEFCDEYVEKMDVLRFFSSTFKENYKNLCMKQMMSTYLHRDKEYIVRDILNRIDKWDIFGFSLIYIHLFACIIHTYSLKHTFLNQMLTSLLVNLHPDSSKRMTIEDTRKTFANHFDQADWTFMNHIDVHINATLFEEFSK
jgi:hypothetical protein